MANTSPNSFKKMLLKGDITSLSDTFKIILMKAGFTFDKDTHHAYANVSTNEVANGLGYTTGGQELAGVSLDINNANDTATLSWTYAEWTAAGGSLVASGAIIYDDSTATPGDDYADAIVSYIDFGETKTVLDGTLLRIQNLSAVIT